MKRLPLIPFAILFFLILPLHAQDSKSVFEKPFMVKVDEKILNTGEFGHAAPYVYDFNSDGKNDLLVGYYGEADAKGNELGKLLVFYNKGTNKNPRYKKGEYFKIDGRLGAVPAN